MSEQIALGRQGVLHNVHFYQRQFAREAKAAKTAVTEIARLRHQELAEIYLIRAGELAAIPLTKA